MLSLLIGVLAVVLFVLISAPMQMLAQRLSPSTSLVVTICLTFSRLASMKFSLTADFSMP